MRIEEIIMSYIELKERAEMLYDETETEKLN